MVDPSLDSTLAPADSLPEGALMGAPLAAFQCTRCPSDSADPEFIRDEDGYLWITMLICKVCGTPEIITHG